MSHEPYNPLSKVNIGKSVADAMLQGPALPLSETAHLFGAGIYAIYYVGGFELYAKVRESNVAERFAQPIYVGKAIPQGSRKGGLVSDAGSGRALRNRLRHHVTSITETTNLEIADFYYRALTVDDIWIPLGENMLIEKFQPIWNRVIDGFGNKTPGKGRSMQKLSPWDELHPGRKFVKALALAPSSLAADEIAQRLAKFFQGNLPEAQKIAQVDDDVDEELTEDA